MRRSIIIAVILLAALPCLADDQDPPAPKNGDLTQLQLEDLMKVKVTTASRTAQPFFQVPAAAFVITQEDIRRSGVTSIPDALRLAPGVNVAQVDANKWAITIRGFNGRYANKLLVLIDGRSVYTPAFAGVFWSQHDLMLEDIERIEVIRGPGGAVWGANAVNGVINVITKHSRDTQGVLASAGGGAEETGFGAVRQGGKLGSDGFYRVYGKYAAHDSTSNGAGGGAMDNWESARGGFRMDWDKKRAGNFMLEGDVFRQRMTDSGMLATLTPPFTAAVQGSFPQSGWNLLGRWEQASANGVQTAVQTFFDHYDVTIPLGNETRNTFDLEMQQQLTCCRQHNIVWGLGYRRTWDDHKGQTAFTFMPTRETVNLYSTFVHDEIALRPGLKLMLGTKLEHNDYTGFEAQPNARLAWTPNPRRTLWAAFSRAVRTPSRADTALDLLLQAFPDQSGMLTSVNYLGSRSLQSEEVLAYELGYRTEVCDRFLVDLAAFYNRYTGIIAAGQGTPFFDPAPPPHVVVPQVLGNHETAETYGAELSARYQASKRWNLTFHYSIFQGRVAGTPTDTRQLNSPENMVSLRSLINLPSHFELDSAFYWVNRIADLGVPDYSRLDVRLGWRPHRGFDLSIIGQNLLSLRHREFALYDLQPATRIERAVFGKATWRF